MQRLPRKLKYIFYVWLTVILFVFFVLLSFLPLQLLPAALLKSVLFAAYLCTAFVWIPLYLKEFRWSVAKNKIMLWSGAVVSKIKVLPLGSIVSVQKLSTPLMRGVGIYALLVVSPGGSVLLFIQEEQNAQG